MSKPTAQQASQLLTNSVPIELIALLGRWKSTTFADLVKLSKAPTSTEDSRNLAGTGETAEAAEDERLLKRERLSDDEEEAAAVKSGGWRDMFRKRSVVDKYVMKDLLRE